MMEDLESLVVRAQSPDENLNQRHAAFTELVRRFQDMVYGCAYALTGNGQIAQDVAQETFLTAYQQLSQLREPKAFPGWLRRIVLTQCHRLARSQRVPTQPLETATYLAVDEPGPTALVETQEQQDRVLAAIQALPEALRLVTILVYINGYSQQEVAGFLEVSLSTVKKRLERARKQLRERMIGIVKDMLYEQRPSNDERLIQSIQLATMLEATALDSQLAMLELLLVDGMSIDARGKDGQTLLHWAAQKGHLDAVELLLQHRATVNLKDKVGKTPLRLALESSHHQVVQLLRQHGAKG